MRSAQITRETQETKVDVQICIDGSGQSSVDTGIGFLDHMLDCFARHSRCDLQIKCTGDLHIDQHHTVEDIGITLGQTVHSALGNFAGIERFGLMECPLDEALVKVVIDISGRPFLHHDLRFHRPFIGALDSSLIKEFFGGFAQHAKWTMHFDMIRGSNDHHICEAAFKAFARASRQAWRSSGFTDIPSTKGTL